MHAHILDQVACFNVRRHLISIPLSSDILTLNQPCTRRASATVVEHPDLKNLKQDLSRAVSAMLKASPNHGPLSPSGKRLNTLVCTCVAHVASKERTARAAATAAAAAGSPSSEEAGEMLAVDGDIDVNLGNHGESTPMSPGDESDGCATEP